MILFFLKNPGHQEWELIHGNLEFGLVVKKRTAGLQQNQIYYEPAVIDAVKSKDIHYEVAVGVW